MSSRLAVATVVMLLAVAAPAAAQDVVGVPQIDIGEAAAVAGSVIRDGSTKIGTIEVQRIGKDITVTATFSRKPPGRRASLCMTIDGDRRCVRKVSKRGLKLSLDRSAPFTASLRATARSADAAGTVSL